MKRIAIKIGSNVLTRPDGTLDITRISHITDQVARLREQGIEVVLISSGAMASGRGEMKPLRHLDPVSQRQLFSAVGQAKLMNRYYEFFKAQNLVCGQILTTKENFGTRLQYLNQKNCIEVMLANGVIPIVNENDTISITELMFTDNDELSGLIATMIQADLLIILSNVNGIYNGNPADKASTVIRTIRPDDKNLEQYLQTGKSQFGRGGMITKCSIARKIAREGTPVIIANGLKENIILKIISSEETEYTRFIAAEKPVSGIKKWLAHSQGFAKGEVYINEGACKALQDNYAASLLPIGIVKIAGHFEKDDIIKILKEDGTEIGLGKAAYASKTAIPLIGKKDARPLIHCDYLTTSLF